MENTGRWMLGFYNEDAGKRDAPNPPDAFDDSLPTWQVWHRDKESCADEGDRVLRTVQASGDEREWVAFGFRDPVQVKAEKVLPDQFVLTSSDLRDEQAQNDS